jgi:hypothetical protein
VAPTAAPPAPPTATTVVLPSPTVAPTAAPTAAPSPTRAPAASLRPTAAAKAPAAPSKPAGDGAEPKALGFLTALNPGALMAKKGDIADAQPSSDLGREAQAAFKQVTSYRIAGDITSKKEGKIGILIEYVAPESMRLRFTLEQPATAKKPAPGMDELEFIAIGTTSYLNLGGAWIQSDGDNSVTSSDMTNLLVEALDTKGLTPQGTETLDGEPCDVYLFQEDGATGKVWVSTRDRLLRKVEGGDADMHLVIAVTDINKPFTIKAPI